MIGKQSGSILVVDDKQNWRDLLAAVLRDDGHQVKTVSSFQEAKRLLEIERFDVAILDMRLVDTPYNSQGMALLRQAKRLYPPIKAIILTGYPDPAQKAKALNLYGADGYLEKAPEGQSFDIDDFSQLILDLLHSRSFLNATGR